MNLLLAEYAFLPIFALRKSENSLSPSGVLKYAKVAQLVEHDLAKVGVASSNLVFRSKSLPPKRRDLLLKGKACRYKSDNLIRCRGSTPALGTESPAQMVELVDRPDLNRGSRKRSAGSIPALSTKPQP